MSTRVGRWFRSVFGQAPVPGKNESDSLGVSFGLPEAALLCLVAAMIACLVAWRDLSG